MLVFLESHPLLQSELRRPVKGSSLFLAGGFPFVSAYKNMRTICRQSTQSHYTNRNSKRWHTKSSGGTNTHPFHSKGGTNSRSRHCADCAPHSCGLQSLGLCRLLCCPSSHPLDRLNDLFFVKLHSSRTNLNLRFTVRLRLGAAAGGDRDFPCGLEDTVGCMHQCNHA